MYEKTPSWKINADLVSHLQKIIHGSERDDIGIQSQVRLSNFPILSTITDNPTLGGYHADIVIYYKAPWSPGSFEDINELQRWFPHNQVFIPISIIEVGRQKSGLSTPIWTVLDRANVPLSEEILKVSVFPGMNSQYRPINSDSKNHFELFWNMSDENETKMDISQNILSEITNIDNKEMFRKATIDLYISEFNAEIFHFSEILDAYENNKDKILIILLSVFFEGYTQELVAGRMEEIVVNKNAGIISKDWSFKQNIDACRFFGLVSENEYRIIDTIRSARNTYAHELDAFHQTYTTSVENDGTLEDAIQVYEEFIGVKDSMIS